MKLKYFKLLISVYSLFLATQLIHAEEPTAPVKKIMPLGDSITYDNNSADVDDPRPTSTRTAYRSHLWYKLQEANYSADFVGSRVAGESITPPFDPDNEGHPGWTTYDIAENVYGYMANSIPDIVLLHIGTNDHSDTAYGVDEILNEIDLYEQQSGKTIIVYVAQIIPRQGDVHIPVFNAHLKEIVESRLIRGDHLVLVNMYGEANLLASDYFDGTHPNASGYEKMAQVWFNHLMAPYNIALHSFPASVVDTSFIQSINFNEATSTVEFTTKVPESGILF